MALTEAVLHPASHPALPLTSQIGKNEVIQLLCIRQIQGLWTQQEREQGDWEQLFLPLQRHLPRK